MSLRELGRINRDIVASAPRWALPFYALTAASLLVFGALILLVATFCMSMRPLYEGRGR